MAGLTWGEGGVKYFTLSHSLSHEDLYFLISQDDYFVGEKPIGDSAPLSHLEMP